MSASFYIDSMCFSVSVSFIDATGPTSQHAPNQERPLPFFHAFPLVIWPNHRRSNPQNESRSGRYSIRFHHHSTSKRLSICSFFLFQPTDKSVRKQQTNPKRNQIQHQDEKKNIYIHTYKKNRGESRNKDRAVSAWRSNWSRAWLWTNAHMSLMLLRSRVRHSVPTSISSSCGRQMQSTMDLLLEITNRFGWWASSFVFSLSLSRRPHVSGQPITKSPLSLMEINLINQLESDFSFASLFFCGHPERERERVKEFSFY